METALYLLMKTDHGSAARMKIEINAMNNIYYTQCLVKYFLIMGTDECPLSDFDMS